MTQYSLHGAQSSLFDSWHQALFSATRLYSTSTEFGILNADGSRTYFEGTGLVWNNALGKFTSGTVTNAVHYSSDGAYVDELAGLNFTAAQIQAAFETAGGETLRATILAGDDTLDARFRQGGQVLPVRLIGYAGNDLIHGGAGADELWGYSGRDTINGGGGNDFVNAGSENDAISGGSGDDRLVGDGGSDSLSGNGGNDAFYAGAGNDTVTGGTGIDTATYYRSFYDLTITKTSAGFQVIEPNGIDSLLEIERIATDEGSFIYNTATSRWDLVNSTPGAVLIDISANFSGSANPDSINLAALGVTNGFGLDGNDTMTGTNGWDLLMGGNGNDSISGEASILSASAGQDRIYGEAGNDKINGVGGTDLLYGGMGADTIASGNGNDTITGGTGNDQFVFRYATAGASAETWGNDIINDFERGVDKILLQFGPWDSSSAPANLTPTLTLTAEGWKLSLADAGSVMLKGLFVPGLTLPEILA